MGWLLKPDSKRDSSGGPIT